jgi:predicted nucleotidyltransferase
LGTGFFVNHRIVLAVKRVEFLGDRVKHIVLGDHCCDIVVLNVHAHSEDKSDDSNESFYKELEQVFDHFCKYILYKNSIRRF